MANVKKMTQRELMQKLFRQFGRNKDRTIEAYAAAELRGEVKRKSNRHRTSPEYYARRLMADGVAKGWLKA